MKLALFIAFRYLRARNRERFISVIALFAFLGIFLGVATLIIVTSVMNGFRDNLYERILGMNGHITIFAYQGQRISDFANLQKQLLQDPNILAATPVIQSETLLSSNKISDGAYIKGIRPEDFAQREFFTRALKGTTQNEAIQILTDHKVLIGIQMARYFNLDVGDKITLYSPFGHNTAFGILPKLVKVEIGGIFAFDMFEYDRNFIFMNLTQAQKFFNQTDGVSRIELVTPHPDIALRHNEKINQQLPRNLYSLHWLEFNGSLYQAIEIERRVTYIVLTLVVLIAALNIISAQIMLVKEKARSIAILRSMGARNQTILYIFTFTGAFIGLSGTFFGSIAGVLIAQNIDVLRRFVESLLSISLFNQNLYHLENLPSQLNNTQTMITILMALAVTTLAALYPARRAMKLNPVDILRYE